ncbi:kelch domain-containing protein 10-like [Haliotis cracherodii]|uniref:kelch domain-containing protein 10-like n=1 Tax=Haliotis cracherodii TaxID=6455 RepID=UPI0039E9EFB9
MSAKRVGKFKELTYGCDGTKTGVYPIGRSGHSMVADDANIYVFGGYNPRGCIREDIESACVLVELWKFNFATWKWTNLTSPGVPDTCASSCMVMRGKRLFVYGGTGFPFGEMMSNTVKVCECSLGSRRRSYWYLLETNPNVYNCLDLGDNMPPRAYGQSLIFHEDCLYTFGGAVGFYDEAVNDLHRLNCRTLIWEKLSPAGDVPPGRYKQEVALYRGRFFVFGGGRLHLTEELKSIFAYEVAANRWEEIRTARDPLHGYPAARCSFGLVQIGGWVYICGGRFYLDSVPHVGLTDIWKISLESFQWCRVPVVLPEKLYFHRVVVSPSYHLYVYGGVTDGGVRSSRMFRWRIPYHVPKLMELSWETVSRHFWALDTLPKETLEMTYGIPRQFVDRIT